MAYAGLLLSLLLRLRKVTSPEGVAAASGFAVFLVLGLLFDWWEQPPLGVFLGVLAGLALTADSAQAGDATRGADTASERYGSPSTEQDAASDAAKRDVDGGLLCFVLGEGLLTVGLLPAKGLNVSGLMRWPTEYARAFAPNHCAELAPSATGSLRRAARPRRTSGSSSWPPRCSALRASARSWWALPPISCCLASSRGLITSPLITGSAAGSPSDRAESARLALTITIAVAVPVAGALAALGAVLPAQFGRGILLFSPWLVPALIQDLGRSIVFRDRRGKETAFSDATWLITMAAAAPFAFTAGSDWAVVGCWGAGAVAGAAVVLHQVGYRPTLLRDATRWWKSKAWPFGRWLLLSGVIYSVASYTTVLALAGILGASDYGGLRAVQSLFAPLTLIGPAIALPGLPLISRAVATSPRRGLVIAWQLAGAITLVTAAYLVLVYVFPGILSLVFGPEFDAFESIMVPIGVAQLLAAPAAGLALFLMAQQRGRTWVWVSAVSVVSAMGFSIAFGWLFGLTGAAWAGAVASARGTDRTSHGRWSHREPIV